MLQQYMQIEKMLLLLLQTTKSKNINSSFFKKTETTAVESLSVTFKVYYVKSMGGSQKS